MKIVAQGEKWKQGSGKSPFDAQFWIERGLEWASTKMGLRVDDRFAFGYGEYTKGMFEDNFIINQKIKVVWDHVEGMVRAEQDDLALHEVFEKAVGTTLYAEQMRSQAF